MATGKMVAEMVMEPSFMQSKLVLNGIHGPSNSVLHSLVVRTTVESGETTRNMGEGVWCCRVGVLCTVCSRKTSW